MIQISSGYLSHYKHTEGKILGSHSGDYADKPSSGMPPCKLIVMYWRFRETYCSHQDYGAYSESL